MQYNKNACSSIYRVTIALKKRCRPLLGKRPCIWIGSFLALHMSGLRFGLLEIENEFRHAVEGDLMP
jgi:hypothetical protein